MLGNEACYALSLRLDRPIEGCQLTPHPFLYIKGGSMDNATRAKLLESNPHAFIFRWSRGPRRQICANQECPRGSTFNPIHWSKVACGGPGLQCAVCERAKIPLHDSMFCSVSCFKNAWKAHCCSKHTQIKGFDRSKEASEITDEDGATAVEEEEASRAESEWFDICSENTYVPTADDVGCVLRVEAKAVSINDGMVLAGPLVVFSEVVLSSPRAPPKRQLSTVPGANTGLSGSLRFRVISYNVLAEQYATKQAYPYADAWALTWPYRRRVLLQELEEAQGDVVCLQEVQADHYEQHISPFMQDLGYDGVFKSKSRESVGYGKVDGCATFWKKSKFLMTETYSIEFNECARQAALNLGFDEGDYRRYLNRLSKDNIVQVVFLEVLNSVPPRGGPIRHPRSQLCVANTHLYSNTMRPDVKLWQTWTLINELEQFVVPRDAPLLLCGDFNSEADSAVYELLSEGSVDRNHPELDECSASQMQILPELHNIGHNLDLSSMMCVGLGNEPAYTNYTAQFKGALDYIWYTPSRLRLLAVTLFPNEEDLKRESGEGLPSASYPSDHLMLCCDVALMLQGTGPITRSPQGHNSRRMHQQMSPPNLGKMPPGMMYPPHPHSHSHPMNPSLPPPSLGPSGSLPPSNGNLSNKPLPKPVMGRANSSGHMGGGAPLR